MQPLDEDEVPDLLFQQRMAKLFGFSAPLAKLCLCVMVEKVFGAGGIVVWPQISKRDSVRSLSAMSEYNPHGSGAWFPHGLVGTPPGLVAGGDGDKDSIRNGKEAIGEFSGWHKGHH